MFSSSEIKPLNINPNREDIYLINEGDLNNIRGDEITVYGPPLHGCTYEMSTYTYADGAWKLIIEPFLIPTACNEMSDAELQNRILKEGGVVYYYDTDVNDVHFRLIKKKARLKTKRK
ncbi:hypothetical protein F0919_10115 [Taibaiella lutea]|uniref:Uncharacterized protein n=1 Tax=Taibaiella lutea TaxID=2608001 RepID=A0A5M6CIL1_9BACT|nr:hypothetical protein [Taibaiella lutea]KAA5534944.1 hypothetical protein F0919_10115 [Taibaiella lutea]